jgi:uncharacterized protein YdhG (YjbR/CyaY superfamily)
MARTRFETVAEYLAAQPPHVRSVLKRVRTIVRKALPKATEGISYQIPVIKIDGRMVLYFAGYAKHVAIYPVTEGLLRELGDEIRDRLHHKATLQFPLDEPLPTHLIARIAKVMAAEVNGAKRKKK